MVKRHLIQLGFRQSVVQQADGDLVDIPTSVHKVTVNLPLLPEACTVLNIAKILDQRIPIHAYDHIVVRRGQSATVFAHESEVQKLLRTSGKEAIFIKLRQSSHVYPEADVLRLPTDHSIDDANTLAQADDSTLGV